MIMSKVVGLLMLFTPFIGVSIILESALGIETIALLWFTMAALSIYLAVALNLVLKDEYWF